MCPQKCNQKFSNCSGCSKSSTCDRTICTFPHSGEEAAKIAHRLVELERPRTGLVGSFYALEKRTGIGHRTWRDWWYGQYSEGVLEKTWRALVTAYQLEISKQARLFNEELEQAKELSNGIGSVVGGAASSVVAAAAFVAGDAADPSHTSTGVDLSSADAHALAGVVRA